MVKYPTFFSGQLNIGIIICLSRQCCLNNICFSREGQNSHTVILLQYVLSSFGCGELDFRVGELILSVFHSMVRTLGGAN